MATTVNRYTRTAMLLHWLVALLMLANLALVWTVDSLPDSFARPMIDTHKSIGITVLGLAVLRVLWRIAHPPPPLIEGTSRLERAGAHAAHYALYVIIFALPISGWMHDSAWVDAPTHPMTLFGLVPWPRIGWIENVADPARKEHLHDLFFGFHAAFAYILYGLFALHVLGALKHQWFDRQAELQRMLPGR